MHDVRHLVVVVVVVVYRLHVTVYGVCVCVEIDCSYPKREMIGFDSG